MSTNTPKQMVTPSAKPVPVNKRVAATEPPSELPKDLAKRPLEQLSLAKHALKGH